MQFRPAAGKPEALPTSPTGGGAAAPPPNHHPRVASDARSEHRSLLLGRDTRACLQSRFRTRSPEAVNVPVPVPAFLDFSPAFVDARAPIRAPRGYRKSGTGTFTGRQSHGAEPLKTLASEARDDRLVVNHANGHPPAHVGLQHSLCQLHDFGRRVPVAQQGDAGRSLSAV